MSDLIQLQILQPQISGCSENYHAMTPHADGAFCGSCNKVVHDLTHLNQQELLQYIQHHPNTCGRVTESTFKPQVRVQIPVSASNKVRMRFLYVLFIAFGPMLFSCTQEQHQQIINQQQGPIIEALSEVTQIEHTGGEAKDDIEIPTTPEQIIDQEVLVDLDTIVVELDAVNVERNRNTINEIIMVGGMRIYMQSELVILTPIDATPDTALIKAAEIKQTLELGLFPNPATTSTTLKYTIYKNQSLIISIFNMNGQEVLPLINANSSDPGVYTELIDVSQWPAGMYLAVIVSGDDKKTVQFNVVH